MHYLMLISSEGEPAPEAMAVMQRELPGWIEQMDARGARLFGRELELPDTAVTVRVRDGETLVTDGPFAEAKEFVAGLDLLDCADADEAIEVASSSPVSRFHPIEIRPFVDVLVLDEEAAAFGRFDDAAGKPYLLIAWSGEAAADEEVTQEREGWRQDLRARGVYVLGGELNAADTATTVRASDGERVLTNGPFIEAKEAIAGIDVVRSADRQQAVELAATHPIARYDAIEVRPFWSE